MDISIVSFTRRGCETLKKIQAGLSERGMNVRAYALKGERTHEISPLTEPVSYWCERYFKTGSGLIFVGATGIAVRAVAPFLKGKSVDPAVVVVDESGKFSIPLLSGHLGGANELALVISDILNAVPVITTATDLNGIFAVDLFAKENGLFISDFTAAKEISAAALEGGKIGFFCDVPTEGHVPEMLVSNVRMRQNIYVTIMRRMPDEKAWDSARSVLRLIPRSVVLGIGCKKGMDLNAIEGAVTRTLEEHNIDKASIGKIASIDLKKAEPGLISFAKKSGVEFVTYSAQALSEAAGDFSESEFVRQVTGVSNVCERAALLGCKSEAGQGRLIVKKTVAKGVTVAVAMIDRPVHF